MTEGQPLPHPDDVTSTPETGNSENIGNLITSLVEQQKTSYGEDRDEQAKYNAIETRVYSLLIDLRSEVSDTWYPVVANVFTAYGSLVYEKLPVTKQAIFLWDARRHQNDRGGDLVLTEEEGGILKNIAHAVGIEYDPGAAETPEKRTFTLTDIEKRAPDYSEVPPPYSRFLDPPPLDL